jgi:hypothetical protein
MAFSQSLPHKQITNETEADQLSYQSTILLTLNIDEASQFAISRLQNARRTLHGVNLVLKEQEIIRNYKREVEKIEWQQMINALHIQNKRKQLHQ